MTQLDVDDAIERAGEGPLAVICGGGSLPYAVADAVCARGRDVVLFALRGWADSMQVARYPHHWIALGQFGRFCRLARQEGCRDVVFIGNLLRPRLTQIRWDLMTLRLLPRIVASFRGGDDHLLSSLGRLVGDYGFRLVGAHEVAPEILAPEGPFGHSQPSARDSFDIERGLAILDAIGPFDVGQAVVVANNHCLAVEGIEGTDQLLLRIAELRVTGRISTAPGIGVLVKAPKPGQNRRLDLPSIGPRTVEGAIRAGLAGIAVVSGGVITAEVERMMTLADKGGIFVVGVRHVAMVD